MATELIAIAVGLVITWLLFSWVIKVLKVSISTALMIGFILLILQSFFGINYQQVWQEFNRFIQQFLTQ